MKADKKDKENMLIKLFIDIPKSHNIINVQLIYSTIFIYCNYLCNFLLGVTRQSSYVKI